MAIPDVDVPIKAVRVPMEWIMRAERAVEKVRGRLLRTARALEQAGVPHAVAGGNAVVVVGRQQGRRGSAKHQGRGCLVGTS